MTRISWNLTQTLESLQNLHFHLFLLCKVFNVLPKQYWGVIFYDTEGWCKIWRKNDLWFVKWHKEYNKFSPECLKVSKLGLWRDPLMQSRKSMTLKFTEELYVMKMKNDAKCEGEFISKLTWGTWQILTRALESLENLHFNMLLLSKVYIVWAKKVQRSYLSWHWRGIQNLERNRLVVSKLA